MRRRTYADPRMQRQYDSFREAHRSGARGWLGPAGAHGLWNDDGRPFRGASGHSAFWNGFNGLTRNGGRLMYIVTSYCRMAYMAGRDVARELRTGGWA